MRLKLFVLYGLVIWGFGGYVYFMETFVYSKWIHLQGEIAELNRYYEPEAGDNEKQPYYDFKVKYVFNGHENLISKTHYSGVPIFSKGDAWPVLVNPKDTSEVRIDDGKLAHLLWTTVLGGSFLIFLGILGFFAK